MKRLHDLKGKTGQRGVWAVSAQLQGASRGEVSQLPAAHSGVQNWFLFEDDDGKVPVGQSEVLG